MKKRVSIILIFTIIISSISLVGCGENFEEQIFEKLQNTYLLDTPLSRFFLDNEFEKTIDSHLVIYIQGENDSLDIDFFGRDLVKNIESFTYVNRIRFNPYDPDSRIRCTRYVVELHQNSKINLLYVAYRLSKLPGVFTVDAFVAGDALAAVPSDIQYNSEDAWGLKSIGAEKVWDFSTGIHKVYVGVNDTLKCNIHISSIEEASEEKLNEIIQMLLDSLVVINAEDFFIWRDKI